MIELFNVFMNITYMAFCYEVNKGVKSTEQGLATMVWTAGASKWEGKGGKCLEIARWCRW
jgi:hypothetical protein